MKLSISDLELMETYDPNYNKNPLINGLEDMNSEVENTVASLALNRFGFAMDKLAETKNYPYATKEDALEAAILMAFDENKILNLIPGLEAETEKVGIITRIWKALEKIFKRIFSFIFGKGSSDTTSIRYYARKLKDQIKSLMNKNDNRNVGTESNEEPQNVVEVMEVLNKITPEIHLVGQLVADAMKTSYTDDDLKEKLKYRMKQMEKSYDKYENVISSIKLNLINISRLSKPELATLYNQTTKFEMLWKQFEPTRKLVESINLEDLSKRHLSNECINLMMTTLKKIEGAILNIRTVVRSMVGKMTSGNETQDYYDDIFDLYDEGTEADLLDTALLAVGGATASYVLYKLIKKIYKWISSRFSKKIEKATKELTESCKRLENKIKEQQKESTELKKLPKVKILDYSKITKEKIHDFEATIAGITNIMNNIYQGNFNSYLGYMSKINNVTNLIKLTDEICVYKEVDLNDFINNQEYLNRTIENITFIIGEFKNCSNFLKSFDKIKDKKIPEDKFNQLSKEKQDAIIKYVENLPKEINTVMGCHMKIKNAMLETNKLIVDSLGELTSTYRTNLNGSTIKNGKIGDILNGSLESESLQEDYNDYNEGIETLCNEIESLLNEYELSEKTEVFFGTESSKIVSTLKNIWNKIITLLKKGYSLLTRQGYRNGEVAHWGNTKVNSGYESYRVSGIPTKDVDSYELFVNTWINKISKLQVKAFKALNNIKPTSGVDYIDHISNQFENESREIEELLNKTNNKSSSEDLTAVQYLSNIQKIIKLDDKFSKHMAGQPNIGKMLPKEYNLEITEVRHLYYEVRKFILNINRCDRYRSEIQGKIIAESEGWKFNMGDFTKIFGPIDRSKAKKPATESLEYLLTL